MLSIIMLSVVAPTVYICIKFKAYHSAAFPTNIRPGLKWMAVVNTVAYYNTTTITTVKIFTVQAPILEDFYCPH